jgi:hypothetical protein
MSLDKELAESLVRLHGNGAAKVATQFAEVFQKSGDADTHAKWLRIAQLVAVLIQRG